jgi:hypothetical protein
LGGGGAVNRSRIFALSDVFWKITPPSPRRGIGVYTKLKNVSVVLTVNRVLDLLEENSNCGEDLKSLIRVHLLYII